MFPLEEGVSEKQAIMGLGIFEGIFTSYQILTLDHHLEHVPGTVLLNEKGVESVTQTAGLKHGVGRDAHIVLAPQPSEDPNDPLNWPRLRKEVCFVVLSFGSILYAAVSVCGSVKYFFLIAGSDAGSWDSDHRHRIAGSNKKSCSSHRLSVVGGRLIWVVHVCEIPELDLLYQPLLINSGKDLYFYSQL